MNRRTLAAGAGSGESHALCVAHWLVLVLYLDDGRLEMDIIVVERAIKLVIITKNNSLFAGSDARARGLGIGNTLVPAAA